MTLHSFDRKPTEAEAQLFALIAAKRAKYRKRKHRVEVVRSVVAIGVLVLGGLLFLGLGYLAILGGIALVGNVAGR